MAQLELDPLFMKGLRLLHSKAKDSAEQLRQLLEDVLAQKQNLSSGKDTRSLLTTIKLESELKLCLSRKQSPKHEPPTLVKQTLDEPKKKETEKRSYDSKIKQEMSDSPVEIKRARVDSPQHSRSSSPSPASSRLEDESMSSDTEDFALEMGLVCVVCKQLDVSSGNQLIECQECHSLYHQECHRPPATDHDVHDPRLVWYCARCTKNMKKMASKTQKPSAKSCAPPVITREVTPPSKPSKPDTPPPVLVQQPFKRSEPKAPVLQPVCGSAPNKPTGLAGLAANLSGKATVTSKSVLPLSKSTSSVQKSVLYPALSSLSTKTASTSSSKVTSSAFSGLSNLAMAASKVSSPSSSKTASRISQANNGSTASAANTKQASSSSLMSADKRLQIMKKKAAAKMQEKRRLSSK